MDDKQGLTYSDIRLLIGELVLSNYLRERDIKQHAESQLKALQAVNESLTLELTNLKMNHV